MPLPVKGNFGGNRSAYTIFRCTSEMLEAGDKRDKEFLHICLDAAVECGSEQCVNDSHLHTYSEDQKDGYSYVAFFGRSWVMIETWPERHSVEVTLSCFEEDVGGVTKGIISSVKEFADGKRTLCVFDVPTPTADPEPNRPDDPAES